MIEVDLGQVVVNDYEELNNKPKINGVEISGELTTEDLNIDLGTADYEELENKPSINDIELSENKTLDELGIASKTKVEEIETELAETNMKLDTIIELGDLGIKETASGEEIHLTDSADGKAVEYALYGKATQKTTSGKNLLINTATSQTVNGITFTVNSDGSVTLNGTATANAGLSLSTTIISLTKGVTYTLTGGLSASCRVDLRTSSTMYKDCQVLSGGGIQTNEVLSVGSEASFIPNNDAIVYALIRIVSGQSFNNVTIYPMLRLASITDDTWEPYTNGASPNPDYPQEIEVAGSSGSVKVKSEDEDSTRSTTATLSTPNGLAGIKVDSGGNYTDQNGQQWICDEVVKYADGSGALIQRVGKTVFNGSESWVSVNNSSYSNEIYRYNLSEIFNLIGLDTNTIAYPYAMCDFFQIYSLDFEARTKVSIAIDAISKYVRIFSKHKTLEELKTWLSSNNTTLIYAMAEPITTPLTAQQLADIETFYPVTNISNDFDCEMKVKYKVDAKNYIDSKLSQIATAMINNI